MEKYLTFDEQLAVKDMELDQLQTENARLREELAAAQADAKRYRWLRDARTGPCQIWETVCEPDGTPLYCSLKHSEELDAAIDDAIAKESGK